MKGWPLARAALALFFLLLLGLPLRKLTAPPLPQASALPAQTVATPSGAPETVDIVVTFTQPPVRFSLKHLGQDLLQVEGGANFDYHHQAELIFPPEGIDLVLKATWPERSRKVGASVQITRSNGWTHSETLWGKKEIEDVLTFSGQSPTNKP